MAESQQRPSGNVGSGNAGTASTPGAQPGEIDPNAPAGTANSVGAESVRDGRPSTDASTVEAIDEAGPGVTPPLAGNKTGQEP